MFLRPGGDKYFARSLGLPSLYSISGRSRVMARFVLEEASHLRQDRQSLSRDDKLALLDAAGTPPRCWICGYEFDEITIESFLVSPRHQSLKTFLDFMKP